MLLWLARQVAGGAIENVHRIQTVNRTETTRSDRLGVSGIDGLSLAARDVTVAPAAIAAIVASVQLPSAAVQRSQGRSVPVQFDVSEVGSGAGAGAGRVPVVLREKSTFLVPRWAPTRPQRVGEVEQNRPGWPD